jgi:hypothetical protein
MFFASEAVSYLKYSCIIDFFCTFADKFKLSSFNLRRFLGLPSAIFNVSCELPDTGGKSFRMYVIAFSRLSMANQLANLELNATVSVLYLFEMLISMFSKHCKISFF